MNFENLNLPPAVLDGIRAAGFTSCTPVQTLVLPEALRGRDIAAQAQTGTGKTAAFLITLFSRMLTTPSPGKGQSPRALIIAPTRELVVQIDAEARVLGGPAGFRIVPVYGGVDYHKQREAVSGNVDVLIGTPGRLIDYLKQNVYSLKKTQFLVIDEADRLFDMGFISDLRFLLRRMAPYHSRQSMLFSATLSHRVLELCYEHMNAPERFSVTPENLTVEQVKQELFHVGEEEKPGLLLGILRGEPGGRYLIFCNMKSTAERIESLLRANNFTASAITGDLPQKKRLRILSEFKEGSFPILVATDVAGRGLHIDGVTHVINYDLPQDPEDYVHRIGRTARAGAEGKAISFACEEFVYSLNDIEDYIRLKIPVSMLTDELIVTDYRKADKSRRRGFRPRIGEKKEKRGASHGRHPEKQSAGPKSPGISQHRRRTSKRPSAGSRTSQEQPRSSGQ